MIYFSHPHSLYIKYKKYRSFFVGENQFKLRCLNLELNRTSFIYTDKETETSTNKRKRSYGTHVRCKSINAIVRRRRFILELYFFLFQIRLIRKIYPPYCL
jgi:hypothetical protein